MKNLVYYLDRPGGRFTAVEEQLGEPGPGEMRIRVRRTSVCQSDCVIYRVGLPRIKRWPAIVLHEVSATVEAVGAGVSKFSAGDLIGIGCDIPCGDLDCIYCGVNGTGDWTSCPKTQATGHEFPGFARTHAILPDWFVRLGPIMKFTSSEGGGGEGNFGFRISDFGFGGKSSEVGSASGARGGGGSASGGVTPDEACHLEPLACCLEGMTRVNRCIENRIVVLIGAGSQSTYALQCAQSMGARKIIVVNRGAERLARVVRDFNDGRVVGVAWDDRVVERVFAECKPFNEPHFVMMNVPAEAGYRLAVQLVGYGTVVDAHAGVKGAGGKPRIAHEIDLNNDIHYKLRCFQATHGSSMHGISLAHEMLNKKRLPRIDKMTNATERFPHTQIAAAVARASDADSLKVIVNWDE